ncbi:unnamed protein product [Anisakis simplex]|uniref:Uncharacterized protein n=1 Tax=Anisakis simplex TaxID=6269 RepID=A0A0M3J9J7_ANISI|nr:unnamed protein product [Anisakis simplex]
MFNNGSSSLHGRDNKSFVCLARISNGLVVSSQNGSFSSARSARLRRDTNDFTDVDSGYHVDLVKTNTLYRRTSKFFSDKIVFDSERRSEEDLRRTLSRRREFG